MWKWEAEGEPKAVVVIDSWGNGASSSLWLVN